jgi:hypothetical protein
MMQGPELPFLSNWQNFYMIMGTAAATLTGLMFVVTTLIAGIETHVSTLNAGISAFHTPTTVHFCAVLLLAGILSAPWQAFASVRLVLSLLGLGMVLYLIIVIRRMRRVPHYPTQLNDWVWYMVFPLLAYVVLIIAALALPANLALALYSISASMILLLLLGIRNAWDLVTFLPSSVPILKTRAGSKDVSVRAVEKIRHVVFHLKEGES